MINVTDRHPTIAAFGFRRRADVDAVIANLPRTRRHIFVVGMAVTPASLIATPEEGEPHASLAEVRAIVGSARTDSRLLYMVKYQAAQTARNQSGLSAQLQSVLQQVGPGLVAMQIAGAHPTVSVSDLGTFIRFANIDSKVMRIAMEVRPDALLAAGTTQRLLGGHIHYSLVSDITLTFPGPVDIAQARALLTDLRSHFGHQVGYGVSGGLTADTVGDLAELVHDFPELSVEMAPADDFDTADVIDFYQASVALFT